MFDICVDYFADVLADSDGDNVIFCHSITLVPFCSTLGVIWLENLLSNQKSKKKCFGEAYSEDNRLLSNVRQI